ncbi:hypothetical protein NX794_23770 [Streptomyces sp. LP11]|uniref:Asp23/Gls24 family envelope stress response protein n=1 Tax=Streptomyces pyxinicus TaxID=2970331 RepID=A0ABT2B6R0_9ACTN|nr:hypothetical protein [Streptomyces sp. LP11]MCS0604208.1 hypothetical protein [Streptomyces sp. LP11]
MTASETGTRARTRTRTPDVSGAVRLRAEGEVGEDELGYLREKVDAVLGRAGLPPVTGEVRVTRADAPYLGRPWSVGAEIRVGRTLVVAHAREATARELADRLQDRLRCRVDRVVHRADTGRRTATPPPWRGGPER